jgi:hypothetical protein
MPPSITTKKQRGGTALVQVVWVLAALLVIAAVGYHFLTHYQESHVVFTTPYQAVLLTNGAVYFGHLQDYGSPHPVLVDAYYIVTESDPNTKQTSNVLVKRGKELHAPDRMYLNPALILLVEPVGTTSKVAQLIEQAK